MTAPPEAVPPHLGRGETLDYAFVLEAPGEAWVALTLTAPGTSWARAEAAVACLEVDGRAAQHLVLAGGEDAVEYARLLGRLSAGPHRLVLRFDAALSAPGAHALECRGVSVRAVPDDDAAAFLWRHAPVLHYRTLDGPLDGLTTDTPLLLFHRPVETADGRGVEYHVIYSHEDAGTDLSGLLACWGHTTDIEWVFRVVRDGCGRIVREEFQGPGHEAVPFRGRRALGGHAMLQVASRNGMVTDRVTSPYRAALAPVAAQPAGEPREGVQYRFPWIHRVSALEVMRQERLEREPRSATPAAADPRAYLYVQIRRLPPGGPAPGVEALARIRGAWYGSAWHRPDLAFRGQDAESTAVKLPPGSGEDEIQAIALRVVEPSPSPVALRFVRAFCLDDAYRPRPSFAGPAECTLGAEAPEVQVWRR